LYAASAAYGSTNTTGTGNYIVYIGTGTTVNVTGLTVSTGYTFDVYEFNGKYMHNKFAAAYDGESTLTMEVAQKMARTPSLWSCWMRRERFEILGLGVKSLKELWRGRH
jgi:hypothetical protein